jgi:arylsulfatase A-like enzyme
MADNTIIIFTSDNGGLQRKHGSTAYGHFSSGSLRGGKGTIWEGGHRVPMIVRYDNHFPVNERRDQLVGLNDLYATLCELAGLTVPYGSAYDSISFADYLFSKDNTERLRDSFGIWKSSIAGAVRLREMKFIEFYRGSDIPRLHNLTLDISEKTNLLESNNTEYLALKDQMKKILDEISRHGPDATYEFRISTGSGFQNETLIDCEFFKSAKTRCREYWEGLLHCRSTCYANHF